MPLRSGGLKMGDLIAALQVGRVITALIAST